MINNYLECRGCLPWGAGGWLTTTAHRKALDRIRRDSKRDDKHRQSQMIYDDPPGSLGVVDDEPLRAGGTGAPARPDRLIQESDWA